MSQCASTPNQTTTPTHDGSFTLVKSPKKRKPKTPPPQSSQSSPFQKSQKTPRTPPPGTSTRVKPSPEQPMSQGAKPAQTVARQSIEPQGKREPVQGQTPQSGDSQPMRQRTKKRARESPDPASEESTHPSARTLSFLDAVQELSSLVGGDRMTVPRKNAIHEFLARMQSLYSAVAEENAALRAEVRTLRSSPPAQVRSYSSVAAQPAPSQPPRAKAQKIEKVNNSNKGCAIFISSKEGEGVKEVQKHLTTILNPRKEKIKIRSLRVAKSVLVVETETAEDAQKIMTNTKINEKLRCEPPRKRRPLLIMYDIPSDMSAEDIRDTIYEQNFEGQLSKDEFNEKFQLKFKTGPREKTTVHHVAEVEASLRSNILKRGRIYLGFRSVNIKDYVVVSRCVKCQDLGHVAKYCTREKATCAHCGEEDHNKQQCEKKNQPAVCIPCQRRGKKCSQQRKDCPTHALLLDRLIQRTDYGC